MPSSQFRATASATPRPPNSHEQLLFQLGTLAGPEAASLLLEQTDETALAILTKLNPSLSQSLLQRLPPERRQRLLAQAPASVRDQWLLNSSYPAGSVGRLMQPPIGVVRADTRVDEAIRQLRELHTQALITYLYALDDQERLVGVVVLRDLFFAQPEQRVADVMITPPFFLTPELPLLEAMKRVVNRHYPVYPVCDDQGRLLGLVRGYALFEKQAYVISAQSGSLVGVRVQERLSTHWLRSLWYRHPWLLFNLIASMLSVAIITLFQEAIRQLVILAIFLPVVAAQARNSSAQTMAVTLRGLTTGEWGERPARQVILKESLLGFLNGVAVGLIGGLFIYLQARSQGVSRPELLTVVMVAAIGLSCAVSALFGVTIPLGLRRLGADPALAAAIILTTIATGVSQAIFLGLAAWWTL